MTEIEYNLKYNAICTSSADSIIKQEAMKELNDAYHGSDVIEIARKQIEESLPETSDIGNGD